MAGSVVVKITHVTQFLTEGSTVVNQKVNYIVIQILDTPIPETHETRYLLG